MQVSVQVSVTEAEGQPTASVRRAEAGEEIILTRHDHAVRLEPIRTVPNRQARRAVLDGIRHSVAGKPLAGPEAARSQDFLHSEDGLPK